eukprot:UN13433
MLRVNMTFGGGVYLIFEVEVLVSFFSFILFNFTLFSLLFGKLLNFLLFFLLYFCFPLFIVLVILFLLR